MGAIEERARAKINLTLRILGRRVDGYHVLESLIGFADIGDAVRFDPGTSAAVRMHGPYAGAITGSNLVDTVLERLAADYPQLKLGSVDIDKRLPIAAGIGGGSADAAAVLRAVRRANPASAFDWRALAASLGADVSVCLVDRASLVWGVGEHVEPVGEVPRLDVVLVCPLGAAPLGKTRSVFARLSVPPANSPVQPGPLPELPDAAALIAYMRSVGNDLREPARSVMPESAAAEAALAALPDCLYVSLSGAGPTSYGIFENSEHAGAAAEQLHARFPDWWIVAATLGN